MTETKRKIDEKKVKAVKELADKITKSKTVMIVSIKCLPSSQFQKIKKDLRGKAQINIYKKTIATKALEKTNIKELVELKGHLSSDCAIAFSNEEAFELAKWMFENRSPVSAKQGQIAEEDINIEAGPTSLMPGPDISLLSSMGLQVSVENGKIAIKKPKIILKKGEAVDEKTASLLQKLEIKPFMVGLNPAVIYDSSVKKVYVGVKIDKKETLKNLLTAQAKALGFSQKLEIITRETIRFLLAKANSHANALNKFGEVK